MEFKDDALNFNEAGKYKAIVEHSIDEARHCVVCYLKDNTSNAINEKTAVKEMNKEYWELVSAVLPAILEQNLKKIKV